MVLEGVRSREIARHSCIPLFAIDRKGIPCGCISDDHPKGVCLPLLKEKILWVCQSIGSHTGDILTRIDEVEIP